MATAATGNPAVGAAAFTATGIALDPDIHEDIQEGDGIGALHHASYHVPSVGSARRAHDAWKEGKRWQTVGHAGLAAIEAVGLKRLGKGPKIGYKVRQILKPNDKIIGKQLGNNSSIHTLSKSEAQQVIKKLIKAGAKKAKPLIDYPGTWYQFPNGKGFGVRVTNSVESLKHGTKNCIDLENLGVKGLEKLKF